MLRCIRAEIAPAGPDSRRHPPSSCEVRILTTFLFWLALATLAVWVIGGAEVAVGGRRVGYLREAPEAAPASAPRVSVVVAARDEERGIEEALRSLLAQRYPGLEVIVVDDRSTDATGEILERVARQEERLRVLHVERLPGGWLGKNHALQVGADAARGEWLLFTDADVVMEPGTAARAVGFAAGRGIDHLAVAPELRMRGPALDLFGGMFALLFSYYAKPWRARDPKSARHVGIGAFNLVRAAAYRAAGGHRPIALRPDDDMMLGKLLKKRGYRQDVLFGRGMIRVEWYTSLGEAVRGLEKNAFAGVGYSLAAALASCAALLLFNVWPFLALFLTAGPTRLLNLGAVAVMLALYLGSTRASGSSPLYAPALPLAVLVFVYAVARSTALALFRGGIRWRGTLYPLDELRANRL